MTLGLACKILSRLGGGLGRSSREPPGVETIMRGLIRFRDMLDGIQLAGSGPKPFFSD